MATDQEIWIDEEPRKDISILRRTTLVVPVPNPAIRFDRGTSFFGPGAADETPVETRVVSAIDKRVLGWFHKHGERPESANVLRVRVVEPALVNPQLEIAAPKGARTLPLELRGGSWECATQFVLMYGADADLEGATFPGIELIDVSASGALGFETKLTFKAAGFERELGVIDVLIQQQGDAGSAFRTARYGIFQTRTPTLKLVCPRLAPNHLEILLDDGDESTKDYVDVTQLLDPTGELTDAPNMAEAMASDSAKIKGEWEAEARRSRLYAQPPEGGDLAVFLIGENRISIRDTKTGQLLYVAHFLLYSAKDETVPAGDAPGIDTVTVEGAPQSVSRGMVALDFAENAKDDDITRYLYGLRLRPRGLAREFAMVIAGTHGDADAALLGALIRRIDGFRDSLIVSVGYCFRTEQAESPSVAMEDYPHAFRDEFQLGDGSFINQATFYYHHFCFGTFPAHRLIDKIRFPDGDPPAMTLSGAHFELDKTFLLPTAQDEVRGIVSARQQHSARKLAIFGHTDASGSDTYNNELSKRRGTIAFALLTRDVNEWMKRLDNSPGQNERPWGAREVQFMLKHLGFYAGNVDGIRGEGTKQAVRDFQGAKGLPVSQAGLDDQPTRRALVQAYMDELAQQTLAAADFFQSPAGEPAVLGCGEAFAVVDTQQPNAQNRRVVFVLRRTEGAPVDLTQEGAAVPFEAWLSQESDGAPDSESDVPDFVVACWDTGFGNSDDLSGDRVNQLSRFMAKGKRLVRPTRIDSTAAQNVVVFADGDLRRITDAANQHGSGVMTSMIGDGIGDDDTGTPRTAGEVVLGTGKDVRFRPIFKSGDFAASLRVYEILQRDPDVKVVSSSFLFSNMFALSAVQRGAIRTRMRQMLDAGKLLFIAAANVNAVAFPSQRDAQRTEGGVFAPNRNNPRGGLSGTNAFQRNISVVAASDRPANGDPENGSSFTYLGDEVSVAAPGVDIRVVLCSPSNPTIPGAVNTVNGVAIQNINGTSFSTPMTAGIAGEMLLANPDLKTAANLPKVIEMLEATADLLPPLSASANPGRFLPGAANADPQLVPSDLIGLRRVNFWKAILAAVNDGIPPESKLPNGNAATTLFTSLTTKDHAATTWYGFELRSPIQDAVVFLTIDGAQVRLEDTGAALPQARTAAATWRAAQPLRAPATHANAAFRGFLLPPIPITGATVFMCQFSIKREEVDTISELTLFPAGLDPVQQFNAPVPPLCRIDLTQVARMRDPAAITPAERSSTVALAQIAAHVEAFDDFVFHITATPQAIDAFVFLHLKAASVGERVLLRVLALDTLGNLKTDFNGTINISHTGSSGVNGPPKRGVFIADSPLPTGATIPLAMVNGRGTTTMELFTTETVNFRASDGAGHNEKPGAAGISIGPPGELESLRLEVAHFDGTDPITTKVRVGDRMRFRATALDAEGRTKTDFRGTLKLGVIEGEKGADPPPGDSGPKRGVQVSDAVGDPLDPARLEHAFVAADNGVFDFSVFSYTASPVVLEVSDGARTARSRRIEVKAGPLSNFKVEHPATATAGTDFNVAVTARDDQGNVVDDLEDVTVRLRVVTGTAGAGGSGAAKSGVHFGGGLAPENARHEYGPGDHGVHNFAVTAHTAETIKLRAETDGGIQTDGTDIVVSGPGPLASLGIEVFASQVSGVRFRAVVKAQDANGGLITTFTGTVSMSLAAGTPFAAAGPSGVGIHIPSHTYVAGDNGTFAFEATGFTVETIRLQFTSGAVNATTPNIAVQ